MTKNWLFALVAGAALGMTFGACGEGGPTDITCSGDTECLEGEVCQAGVCAVTCTAAADCPDSAKTCAPFSLSGDAGTADPSVCQCSTDANCNSEGQVDLLCQSFKLCTPKCGTETGYSCPTGYTCDSATGACNAEAGCTTNNDCASGETCNTNTGACEVTTCDPTNTTIGSGGGLSNCNYGEKCVGTDCQAITQGTCSQTSNAPAWSASNTDRPVITSVTAVSSSTSNSTTECGDGGKKTVFTVQYYSPTALFTSNTFATWKGQVFARFGGANYAAPAFEITSSMPSVNEKVGQFTFGVCGPANNAGAVYVTLPGQSSAASNTVCLTW